MLFDSHAHYNDERFKDDVDEVLSAMNENNVGLILNSCSSLDEVPDIFAICEKYPFVYAPVRLMKPLLQNRYGKTVCAVFKERFCNLQKSVTVCVGFYYRHYFCIRICYLSYFLYVMSYCIKVNLCPSSFIHCYTTSFPKENHPHCCERFNSVLLNYSI